MRIPKWIAVLAALLLLAGCKGSSDDDTSSPPGFEIPAGDTITTATEACFGCHAELADGGSVPVSVPHDKLVTDAAADTGNVPTINSVEIIEQAEVTAVTVVADSSGSLNDTYFTFSSADDTTDYYVWYNVNSAGTDPVVAGATGIEVAIATDAAADVVSGATEVAIDGSAAAADVTTIDDGVDEVEITNVADGPATDAADGSAATGFDFDVTTKGGDSVLIDVNVDDELGAAVAGLQDSDFRFTFAQLVLDTAGAGGNYNWESYISNSSGVATYERGSGDGTFNEVGLGNYTYSLSGGYDLSTDTDTHRVSLQVGSGIANHWIDWVPNDDGYAVGTPVANPREIVTTDGCNMCHAELGDATVAGGLAMHGSSRRNVEYCVTCHNPGSYDTDTGNTVDFKVMIHKIHMGKNLPSVEAGGSYQIIGYGGSVHDYSLGAFPQDIGNCDKCHAGGDGTNWYTLPTMEACGSCHDTTSWAATVPSGMTKHAYGSASFPTGVTQTDNAGCGGCHGNTQTGDLEVQNVHPYAQAITAAAPYSYNITSTAFDSDTDELTVVYTIEDGANMDLATDTEWTDTYALGGAGASRLYMTVAWKPGGAADYTNHGAGSTSAPGYPLQLDLLCFTGCTDDTADISYTNVADGAFNYTVVIELPSGASGTGLATIEGHPYSTIGANDVRLQVANEQDEFLISGTAIESRRIVVDATKCENCHGDAAGAGGTVSLHGNNRTLSGGGVQECVVCHNSANTDVNRRQGAAASNDGQAEQSIEFKTMIHRIHRGRDSEAGSIEVWGYGGSQHIFAGEFPPGNRFENCENCHVTGFTDPSGASGVVDAYHELPIAGGMHMEGTTVDSGADVSDHDDDLNISPNTSTCSACHDKPGELVHMQVMGGNLNVLEEDILFY